jgi:hypothetical protein
MQARRLLIKLCLALALLPFCAQAADVKVTLRSQHWSLRAMLLGLERPYAPAVSQQHVQQPPKTPPASGPVFVGGIPYYPQRRD